MKEIPLTKGYTALVDDKHYERLSAFKWCVSCEGRGTKLYAVRFVYGGNRKVKIRMHREVLFLPPFADDPMKTIVNHKDSNGLNNQESNLQRLESQRKNMLMSTGWSRSAAFPGTENLSGNFCEDCGKDTGHIDLHVCDSCVEVIWG